LSLPSPTAGRILVHLQGLRAIAASAVIVDHAMNALIVRGLLDVGLRPAAWLLGWMGVALFFVISGFIMIRTAANGFGSAATARTFLRRRIVRIVPLYWVATAIYTVLRGVAGEGVRSDALIRSLVFLPYRAGTEPVMRPIVGQGWTLNYEIVFYIAFAACLLLPRRFGIPLLLLAFPLVVMAGLMVRPLFPYADPVTPLAFWTDPIILQFGWGIAIGLFGGSARMRSRLAWPLIASVAALLLATGAFVTVGGGFPLQCPWQLALGLLCAAIVAVCAHTTPATDGRALRALTRLGDASFSTYLFHPIGLTGLAALAVRMPLLADHPALFVVAALIGCNVTGYAVFVAIERPLLRVMRQRPRLPAGGR
jgi:peptidoglycan/LPS O-acetylase OafA/YrhL